METLLAFFGGTAGSWLLGLAGFASVGAILDWILKKYITADWLSGIEDWIANALTALGYPLGVFITAGFSKWPITARFWNKTFEPWIVIIVRTIFRGLAAGVSGLIERLVEGLESDNPSTKE